MVYVKIKPGMQKLRAPKATISPSLLDIAWAAGIYEGEGWAGFSTGQSVSVHIAQKDPWILYKLAELFGGTVAAKAVCPYWHVHGPRAKGFLQTIFTYLSPRRRKRIKELL